MLLQRGGQETQKDTQLQIADCKFLMYVATVQSGHCRTCEGLGFRFVTTKQATVQAWRSPVIRRAEHDWTAYITQD